MPKNQKKAGFGAYRGAILAAGRGQRLRPLTNHSPKPLVPFFGVPLFYLAQWRLAELGVKRIIVNAHYQWEAMAAALGKNPLGLQLSLSLELPHILGTGGAFAKINPLRESAPLIVVNGDIVSDFPLASLVRFHEEEKAVATMALLPEPHPGESAVWAYKGRVVGFGGDTPPQPGATPHGFACMQVLSDGFLNRISEEREESVISYYKAALTRGEVVGAYVHPAFWHDLGTPAAYAKAHFAFLDTWQQSPFSPSSPDPLGLLAVAPQLGLPALRFVAKGESWQQNGVVIHGPSLIDDTSQWPEGSQLGPYLALPKQIKPLPTGPIMGAHHCVVLPNACLKAEEAYESVVVTADELVTVT